MRNGVRHGFGVDADGPTSTGSLYGLAQPEGKQLHPAGHWNTGRIVVRGWHVEHWVNGVKVVDADLGTDSMRERIATTKFAQWPFAQLDAGHIALQDHGDAVRYRSLRIRTFE